MVKSGWFSPKPDKSKYMPETGKPRMKKNIVIVDVDVDFKKLVKRVKSPFGGYVSLEYYYEVDDSTFAELEKSSVVFS